ncbi:adenine deaminase [Aerococcaceae bacterium WGS1372]
MNKESLKHLIDVAAGRKPADLVIKNAKIVDVYQGQMIEGDIAITNGLIAGIGQDYDGAEIHNLQGKVIAPGFIEPHIHVESSLVTPEEFGRLLAINGTTTALADPHEFVNVAGMKGLTYMIQAKKNVPVDIRYMLPSCVPATNMENSGAEVTAQDMIQPLRDGDVDGLAEFMNFPGIINNDDDTIDKVMVARQFNKRIDGHSPMVAGKELNAYVAAGVSNDHECTTVEEMHERLSRGMYVFLREGSVTQNLRKLLKGVTVHNSHRCVLTGDDIQAKTFLERGHLNYSVRVSVEEGIDIFTAIQMATLNAAQACQLNDRGAIAPGLRADFVVFNDLEKLKVHRTYAQGQIIAQDGQYLVDIERESYASIQSSVRYKDFSIDRLSLPLTSNKARAIEVIENEAITNDAIVTVDRDDQGHFQYNPTQDIVKISVIERHNLTGNVAVALLKGYGMKHGAIAQSIAHDNHNVVVAGTNDSDMAFAVQEIERLQGGIVLVKDGEVIASLALPVGGLMSDLPAEGVASQLEELNRVAYEELEISEKVDPTMTLGFMPLAVIPNLKLTDMGLVDVTKFKFVDVTVD